MPVEKNIIDKQIVGLGNSHLWKSRKEVSLLYRVIEPQETIAAIATGKVFGKSCLIVATCRRICFVYSKNSKDIDITDLFISRIKKIKYIEAEDNSKIHFLNNKELLSIDAISKIEAKSLLASLGFEDQTKKTELEKNSHDKVMSRIWSTVVITLLCVLWIGGTLVMNNTDDESKSNYYSRTYKSDNSSYYSSNNYTVKISGTQGLRFSGAIGQTDSDYSFSSKSVSGTVPATYNISAANVSVCIQKESIYGLLEITILKDGIKKAHSQTEAEYGVVDLAVN